MIRSNGYATISATIKHVNRKKSKENDSNARIRYAKKMFSIATRKKSNAVKM